MRPSTVIMMRTVRKVLTVCKVAAEMAPPFLQACIHSSASWAVASSFYSQVQSLHLHRQIGPKRSTWGVGGNGVSANMPRKATMNPRRVIWDGVVLAGGVDRPTPLGNHGDGKD